MKYSIKLHAGIDVRDREHESTTYRFVREGDRMEKDGEITGIKKKIIGGSDVIWGEYYK